MRQPKKIFIFILLIAAFFPAKSLATTSLFNYEVKSQPLKQKLANCRQQLKLLRQKISQLRKKAKTKKVKRMLRKVKAQKNWHIKSYRRWRKKLVTTKQIGVFMFNPYEDIPAFEGLTGHKLDVFLWYQSIIEDFDLQLASWLAARGVKLELAWEPRDPSKDSVQQPAYSLKTIAAGAHDTDIRRWARQIKAFGLPLYFRPMSEMNGDWTSWSGGVNGNQPQDYVAAWRRLRQIFLQEGATNAQFVWSPNRDGSLEEAKRTFVLYYPGDAYVDYIGFNGYNWGTLYNTPSWTSVWQSFTEVFGSSYQAAVMLSKKPIIIAEMATTDVGGSKALWIQEAFTVIKKNYPRIKAVVWFNVNKETDWRLHATPESLAAFIKYAY